MFKKLRPQKVKKSDKKLGSSRANKFLILKIGSDSDVFERFFLAMSNPGGLDIDHLVAAVASGQLDQGAMLAIVQSAQSQGISLKRGRSDDGGLT